MSNESKFNEAMMQKGINCSIDIKADGKIHRFASNDKPYNRNQDCWYVFFGNGGAFGDWSRDINEKWFIKSENMTRSEKNKLTKQIKIAQEKVVEDQKIRNLAAAEKAQKDWYSFAIDGDSDYLANKQVKAFGVSYGDDKDGGFIVIPLKDVNGELWSYQKIYGGGRKHFLKEGRKKGCFHMLGSLENASSIYVAEGYSTGASVHMATGKPVVVAVDAGNIDSVVNAIRDKYPELLITIAGDNDQWKDSNIGKVKAEEAACKYSCSVVFPIFKNSDNQPTDFNDLHISEGLEEVKRQLEEKKMQNQDESLMKLPPNFSLRDDGLYYEDSRICGSIEICADTRDEQSENWGRTVRFRDKDQHIHQLSIPMGKLVGECNDVISLFNSRGLCISTKRNLRQHFLDFLQHTELNKMALCVPRIGWYKGHFIFPNSSIPETDDIFFQGEHCNAVAFSELGTLQDWQEQIAKPCQGNSLLIFALSSAFAAPLLPLHNGESGGFNLRGSSSIGKSTALSVAASVWGSPKYIQQWRATGNALEAVAESHNHALLCLDELGQIDGKEAGEITYMIANGCGKNRMNASAMSRKKYEWKLLFLSTGEISIRDKMLEHGKKIQAGMVARVIDVPADADQGLGIFETIHDFKDAATLAIHLKDAVSKYYGIPIRIYLEEIAKVDDKLLANKVAEIEKDFYEKCVSQNADGQVKRVADRFIRVAAGGELAIEVGILPYEPGEAFDAAVTCFKAWLETERISAESSYEAEAIVRQVRSFIESSHASHFLLMNDKDQSPDENRSIHKQAGFKRKVMEHDELKGYEFFVFPEFMRNEICKGLDHTQVCKVLYEGGFLLCLRDRSKFTKQQKLPIGKKSIYHLAHTILSDN